VSKCFSGTGSLGSSWITTTTTLFNGLSPGLSWVRQHQKGKPFWILVEQEMMGWQWHQLCKSFAPRSRQPCQYHTTQFLQAGCPS